MSLQRGLSLESSIQRWSNCNTQGVGLAEYCGHLKIDGRYIMENVIEGSDAFFRLAVSIVVARRTQCSHSSARVPEGLTER